MDKSEYAGALRNQCMSLPDLCEPQIEGIVLGLKDTIPAQVLKGVRRVIVTGCGDSYLAAKACIPAFKKYAGAFASNFIAARAIDVAQYLDLGRNAGGTLVIAVSASGGASRLQELLRRANSKGCLTLALTNRPDSKAVNEAKYSLIVNTPDFATPSPGLRSYYASYMGLYALAVSLGQAKGIAKADALDDLFHQIRTYTAAVADRIEAIDDQMFELAQTWKDFRAFETVGDDVDYSSAHFIAAKIVEVAGTMSSAMDSEDWCHVNFFARDPEAIGTIVVGDVTANNRTRIGETAHQAAAVGRPVLLIANGSAQDFGIEEPITVCTLPKTPAGYEFLSAMLAHVPGSILASYISALLGEPYFRNFIYRSGMTLGSSAVVVADQEE